MTKHSILLVIALVLLLTFGKLINLAYEYESSHGEYARHYEEMSERNTLTASEFDMLVEKSESFDKKVKKAEISYYSDYINLLLFVISFFPVLLFLKARAIQHSLVYLALTIVFWCLFFLGGTIDFLHGIR